MHFWRVVHGVLNPGLCVLFGYLWKVHVSVGWRMKANRPTGSALVVILTGLIVSGAALYYMSSREAAYWTHATLGVLLPAGLTVHILASRRWRKIFK